MRILIGTLCGLLVTCAAHGADAPPVQVMVLGTYHMDNPGQDLHNVQAADVLTPRRQAELAAVVKSLAAFKPTVLAIERVTAAPGYVDGRFAAFDGSQLALDRDERVQVGYRLAREAGLGTVHGIDEQPSAGEPDYFPFDRVHASVHARGEDRALGALMESAGQMVAAFGQRQAEATIAELLRDANDPRTLANSSMYYQLLLLDTGEDQPGAELLGYWYMRNAKIAAKLMDIARPGDRVVVIFGAGHKHWLEQLLDHTPGFQVVDPLPYL